MSAPLKATSLVLTVALGAGAVAIGGGVPVSPTHIADSASRAAENASIARDNTERAEVDTRALGTISKNVGRQLETSRAMLQTQLEIQRNASAGVERARSLNEAIVALSETLRDAVSRLRDLAGSARRTSSITASSAAAAGGLMSAIRLLRARFDEVVKESRELNRKARGYEKLRETP